MNSLSELNGYSQTPLSYTDDRNAAVIFDRIIPIDQFTTTAVGQAHLVPAGIEITEIIKPELMNVYYEIDVSFVPGASVSWPVTPPGCAVSNPSVGVYRMSGISSKAQWDLVKNPSIVIGPTWDNDFIYYPSIHYDPSKTKEWYVVVLVGVIANVSAVSSLSATLTGITTNSADIQAQSTINVNGTHIKSLQASLQSYAIVTAQGDIAIRFNVYANVETISNAVFGPSPSLNSVASFTSNPVKKTDTQAAFAAAAALTHPGTPRLRTSAVPLSSSATLTLAPRLLSITRQANGSDPLAMNNTSYFIANETDNAVYVYNKSTRALTRTINNPNPYGSSLDIFGRCIRANDTYLVVGAPAEDVSPTILNVGKVYVFNASTGALVGTCSNPSNVGTTSFGTVMAFDGSQVFVGNQLEDYNGYTDAGSVHVFAVNGSFAYTLRPPEYATVGTTRFGSAVFVGGGKLVVVGNVGTYVYNASTGAYLYKLSVNPNPGKINVNSTLIGIIDDLTYNTVNLYDISTGTYVRTIDTIPPNDYPGSIPGQNDIYMTDIYLMRYNTVYTIGTGNVVWSHLDKPSGSNSDWAYIAFSNSDVLLGTNSTFDSDYGTTWIYKI